MLRTVMLKGKEIQYDLIFKDVKNINVRIKPDGSINVSANRRIGTEYIDGLLSERADYILSTLNRFKTARSQRADEGCVELDRIMFLGDEIPVKIIGSHENKAEIKNGELLVFTYHDDDGKIKKVIDEWYDVQCKHYFDDIGNKVYHLFEERIKKCPEFTYKYMKSIWGSCNPVKYRISINKKLIRYDTRLIEFVFCHEFSHLLSPDHSSRFYDVLSSVMPDHDKRKKELKEVSSKTGNYR